MTLCQDMARRVRTSCQGWSENRLRQVDAGIERVDRARRSAGVSIDLLARRAGLPERSYRRYVAGLHRPGGDVVERLERALVEIVQLGAAAAEEDPAAVRALMARRLAALALSLGLDPAAAAAAAGRAGAGGVPGGHVVMRARREAVYLTAMHLGLPGAALARVLGISRQAVSRMLADVEASREDPAVDARLAAVERRIGALG